MCRKWINYLMFTITLAGCATDKEELLAHDDQTMHDIWNLSGTTVNGKYARQLLDARQVLRRPLNQTDTNATYSDQTNYTRNAMNEIHQQFHRLPNPDLVMYVYPHLTGTDPVPIPGYATVFPFYQRVQYALPGERIKDY